jgi:hypothetical protein
MRQADTTAFINRYLADQWKAEKITPAPRCTDEEFIRRISLDIIGRIATPDEVQAFTKDDAADKRAKLIDRLLASEGYASHWAGVWLNWLLPRTVTTLARVRMGPINNHGEMAEVPGVAPFPALYRNQLRLWLEERFADNISYQDLVIQLLTATGKCNDNGATNFILGNLGTPLPPAKQAQDGAFDMVPLTSRSMRVFLGYRFQRAQFEDDPNRPDCKQSHFWGINAFFRQVERVGVPSNTAQTVIQNAVLELKDNPAFNVKGIVSYERPAAGLVISEAQFLPDKKNPGARLAVNGKQTRREQFARFMTNHANFAPATVSRLWGQFFGCGFHASLTVDDFGSHNKLVHPELLDRLAKDFADGGYDPKKLIRWICTSDAYQLQSVSNDSNIDANREVYFSRMPLRLLSPEQLAESLATAVQLNPMNQRDHLHGLVLNYFARRFEGNEWPNVPDDDKLVYMERCLNQREVGDLLLTPNSGTLTKAQTFKTGKDTMNFVFLAVVNRPATNKEYTQLISRLPLAGGRIRDEATGPLHDLFWALLHSGEFILNH